MNRSRIRPTTIRRSDSATCRFLRVAYVCPIVLWLAGCGGTEDANRAPSPDSSDTSAESTPADNTASTSVAGAEATATTAAASTPVAEGDATASTIAQPAPEPAKSEPPAEPEVTVDETPRPPATVEQAAKLLDLRTFPLLEGAHIRVERKSIGTLTYSAPDDVATAFKFQREELKKRGWKELPGARESGENPAATFTQEGFVVYMSVSPYGSGPNGESGWSMISLTNHGNVLAGKLPVPEGVEPKSSGIFQVTYVTEAPLNKTAKTCKRLLLEAGWQPYGEASHKSHVGNSHAFEFKQNAVLLSADISDHSSQPGKTFIRYTTTQLTADIPAPPGVPDFRYRDSSKRMNFYTKDSAQDVAAYYVEALGELGWTPTTDELVVNNRGRDAMMVFRNEAGDRIDLDMDVYDDETRVQLQHLTPAEIAELDRQIAALARKREQEAAQREQEAAEREAERKAAAAKRREALTHEFPIPEQAKGFVLEEDGDGLEITMPGGTGTAALAAVREHFIEAGWEEQGFHNDETSGSLSVKRGESSLSINYVNIDKEEDFEIDVTCFTAYLKPVKAGEDGSSTSDGEETKPES